MANDDSKQEEKPFKVEKWDHNAVRIALDDAAKKIILDNLGYQEDFKLIDTRLAICTTAVLFALFALLWDYLHPFPASRPVIILCVVSYFVLMGVLTAYANFVEKNVFLLAREKDIAGVDPDIVWTLSSTMPKYDENYTLQIVVKDPQGEERKAELTKSAGEYFDENGQLMDSFEIKVMELHRSLSQKKKAQ
ncbi:signal peptidase complex subunit 2-like [Styela clava]|uniref:probable signal peptidase complex subunit 2 n=1 Tax=Styela clava TaxID=7725 RepID=UPI001939F58A|nr:probable signal peptidase complex subunit 2 [Styela clava]